MTTVEFPGAPKRLTFPPICANCGTAASERLTIAKVFERMKMRRRRNLEDPTRFVVVEVDVPFCGSCATRHRDTVVETSALKKIFSFLFSTFLIPVFIAIFAVYLYLRPVVFGSDGDFIAVRPNEKQLLAFVSIGIFCAFLVWLNTRRFRIPQGSEISRAFDFDRVTGYFWQRTRYAYKLRNDAFASAFAAANER